MIKGIDAQVITNRSADYAKDVSAMLRRDELSKDFANRLNQTEVEQSMRSVTQMEEASGTRINADERGGEESQPEDQGKRRNNQDRTDESIDEGELPSVGSSVRRLLDIEV